MNPQRRIAHAMNQLKIAERMVKEARTVLLAALRAQAKKAQVSE